MLALLVGGCGSAAQDQVLRRAAFELRCPEEQLQVIELDDRTQGVRGCGYQVQYVEVCEGPGGGFDRDCRWVMSAPPPPVGGAQPAPPGWTPPVMPPVQPSLQPPIQTGRPPPRAPR
jgi:hypothetical protein